MGKPDIKGFSSIQNAVRIFKEKSTYRFEIIGDPSRATVTPNAVARRMSAGTTVQNIFNVAGDVSQSTVDRLKSAVISAHKRLDNTTKTIASAQRAQLTGVG